jgi:hypothetical protein
MTKECKVILNNDAVTVVKFGEISIQFPSIHREVDTVFVKADNGRYSIVDKMEEENNNGYKNQGNKKPLQKKATNEMTEDTAEKADSTEGDK